MKNFFSFLAIFLFFISSLNSKEQIEVKRKKIYIFTCGGGGGHISASNAISDVLSKEYEVKSLMPITNKEIFADLDFMRTITFGRYTGEGFYNLLLRNGFNWLINKYNKVGSWWIKIHTKRLSAKLFKFFEKEKPDMVISVMPYINGATLNAAQKANIPFLIIPTDLDTKTFALGINSPKYNKFTISLAYKDSLLIDKLKEFNIPKENIKFIGYPLRESFFQEKNKEKLKKELKIKSNKPAVMILMGAQGAETIKNYVYNLTKNKVSMHLIICIGKNEKLRKKIERIHFPKHITYSIFGFTDRIADLMNISDLLISKPGTHSVCEAIQSSTPILIDQTNTLLQWEVLNGEFIEKYQIGDSIKSYRQINKFVEKFLTDRSHYALMKKNLGKLKNESFSTPLLQQVKLMLES